MLSTLEDGKVVRGLAGIPSEGPVLYVGYHMLLGFELAPLVLQFLMERNILLRGIAHPMMFTRAKEGRMLDLGSFDTYRLMGAVPVSGSNFYKLLSSKSHALLYPGGVREALHRKGEEYKLFWPEQSEFVRMASRFGAKIVPFGVVGEDDVGELVFDYNDQMQIPSLRTFIKELTEEVVHLRIDASGEVSNQDVYLPGVVPKLPGRFYYYFGKPIETKERKEELRNRERAHEVYLHVKTEKRVNGSIVAFVAKVGIEKLSMYEARWWFVRHVLMEHTVFFAFEIGALGGLRTYWTRVWMIVEYMAFLVSFFERMRSEIAIFYRFLRAGFVTLPCELDSWANPTALPYGLVQGSIELDLQRGEIPMLVVFQHLYQLKGRGLEDLTGFYCFSHCKKVQTIIRNHCSNLKSRKRLGDKQDVAQSVGVLPDRATWPHDSFDQLGQILLGRMAEPFNLFYHFYQMKLRLFSLIEIIAGGRIYQGSKDTSSGTDSLSRELNEAMDIDSLVSGARKKRKTTAGAVRINSASKDERNSAQQERRSKKGANPVGFVVGASSPSNFLPANLPYFTPTASSSVTVADDTYPLFSRISPSVLVVRETPIVGNGVETKAKGLEHEVATERESKEALQVELDGLIEEHAAETDRIIWECQDQVDDTIREHLLVFDDFTKKTAENVLSSILNLKMNILLHTQVIASPFDVRKVDLDALKGSSPDFHIKEDPAANEDAGPSVLNNDVIPSDDVHQGVDRDNMS
ncbi:hypothetical protein Godav_014707 [Gossypium davidsonii]|uniref:Acyltransferase n=1 Tax=Gossypium davidsonii TaxID=34287 RepID=A0A7J8RKK9_GOSDV|nr:hypothetical protein [Gossypium davidsonii]